MTTKAPLAGAKQQRRQRHQDLLYDRRGAVRVRVSALRRCRPEGERDRRSSWLTLTRAKQAHSPARGRDRGLWSPG